MAHAVIIGTFLLLQFTKVKTPIVIVIGVVLGLIF
jgi:hypothetical protein